jgi:hypothetical protein
MGKLYLLDTFLLMGGTYAKLSEQTPPGSSGYLRVFDQEET